MNYERIAEMVHQCVKNPNKLFAQENRLAEMKVKNEELSIIQTVFSKYNVSGNAMSIEATTLELWF